MKMMVMKMMMYISTMILMLKTPMSMGVMLLIQTMMCTIIMTTISTTSWMPMIMFLMLIGGLMILFMYMSSIASNEKFSPNIFAFLTMLILILPFENMLTEELMQDKLESIIVKESMSMMKIYNVKTMMITVMLFLYLLLCMIAVMKILKIYKGPLRSKYE
uniref:NADH dehydrogenase subunit 6 n=1 Tax=Hishimonoides recurvatis TaxID=1970786 RepID=A0A499P3A6_9HEMI|nr:NADH dehydrogenase subunit 6 [Hishimonoides recurvatis]